MTTTACKQNSLAPNCFDVKSITIIVNKLPEPTPEDGIIYIKEITTGSLLNLPFFSGLLASTHTFNGLMLLVSCWNCYRIIKQIWNFSLITTNNATGCSSNEVFVRQMAETTLIAYTVK
jgi:hypothetical protein